MLTAGLLPRMVHQASASFITAFQNDERGFSYGGS